MRAADWSTPRLGLSELPVIEVPNHALAFGWSSKSGPIRRRVDDCPVASRDGPVRRQRARWAEDRRSDDAIATLIVPIEVGIGLRRRPIDDVNAWLDTDVATHLEG
ncbi:hypothetical protein ACIA5G_30360 [Amycolatopsis sp. NPDC051758]|uniref:hypothetical protein n=1 Tax=Amycolatopsis sp. NPDC051758 TaxID=3363935 RepID=UPI0037B6DE90